MAENGYLLFRLALAQEISGKMPVVVDADDLVQALAATIKAYCEAVGIAFCPDAL